MNSETLKLLIPLATFVLGSLLTLGLKFSEQRRSTLRTSVQESVRLTKEWYIQIHTLCLAATSTPTQDEINTGIYDYVHNRLILPDLVYHFEVLRRSRRARHLVLALGSFLEAVTNYQRTQTSPSGNRPLQCLDLLTLMPNERAVLATLDTRLQEVIRAAAELT